MAAKSTSTYLIPGAIVTAGLLIAGALFYGGSGGETSGEALSAGSQGLPNSAGVDAVRAIEAEDHIRGNPEAAVAIIEYSDFECPFCARLHPTLSRIVEENDDVTWVYRHFPLSSIHSRAERAAVASECVAELADNDSFWQFADAMFANQRDLGDDLYMREAIALGVDETLFTACLNNRSVREEVAVDYNEAISAGGRGTPFSILVTASGSMVPFSGALPYEQVNALVEQARVN